MKQYIVKDDQIKLACYTLLNFTLTLLLLFAILYLFGNQYFLLAFFAMTALWFSVKYMCRYGSRYIRKQPVCVCKEQYVLFHSWTNDEKKLRYQEIKEVRLLRDWKSVKLFFPLTKSITPPAGGMSALSIILSVENWMKSNRRSLLYSTRIMLK